MTKNMDPPADDKPVPSRPPALEVGDYELEIKSCELVEAYLGYFVSATFNVLRTTNVGTLVGSERRWVQGLARAAWQEIPFFEAVSTQLELDTASSYNTLMQVKTGAFDRTNVKAWVAALASLTQHCIGRRVMCSVRELVRPCVRDGVPDKQIFIAYHWTAIPEQSK